MISLGSLYQFLRADWASLEQIWPVLKSRFDQFGQLVSKREDVSFPFLDERRFLAEILGLDVDFYFVASPLGTVIFCRFGCSGSC